MKPFFWWKNKTMKISFDDYTENKWLAAVYSSFIFARAVICLLLKRRFSGISDLCWLVRSSDVELFNEAGRRMVKRYLAEILNNERNIVFEGLLKTSWPQKITAKYAISGVGNQDIFRDIIVLKEPSENEKGVILLKYAQTFDAFIYFFDAERLMQRYYFVLEPCWAGYCNSNILSWLSSRNINNTIIECFTKEDYEFIAGLQPNFIPVRLGPADWVDIDNFKPSGERHFCYDIIMVSNWASIKRHRVLFKALSKIRGRKISVLLIGYPWGGRTLQDVLDEAAIVDKKNITIEAKENLSHSQVVKYLNMSRFFVFLTRKEGDNKALVEAMLTDVPAIVYKHTVGGAKTRINPSTGILSTYDELKANIIYMMDHHKEFSPRKWALENTGSFNSTARLNNCIKQLAKINGEFFTRDIAEKINSPNLEYKHPEQRQFFEKSYDEIQNTRKI